MNERSIFLEALDKDAPAQRRAYLDEACGADAVLRQRLEALLTSHEHAGSFLGKPAPSKVTFLAFTDGKSIRQATLQPHLESVKLGGKVISAVRLAGNTSAGPFELWVRTEDGYPIRMRLSLGASHGATLDQKAKDIPAALVLF